MMLKLSDLFKSRYIILLIIVLIFLSYFFVIISNFTNFTKPFNPTFYSWAYSVSQYNLGEKSTRGMNDGEVYTYAGYHYIRGGDPSKVNFEHPPLGKYIIGLSIIFFNDPVVLNILLGAFVLIASYYLCLSITKNNLIALFTVFLLSVDPVFQFHIKSVLLDLPFSLFTLGALIFYLKAEKRIGMYFIMAMFIGLMISTKFYLNSIVIFPIIFFYTLIIRGRKHVIYLSLSLVISLIIYLISYSAYFYYHPSVIDFLKYQKWITYWWFGTPKVLGNIFIEILTGKMVTWWDGPGLISIPEWSIIHPIITILSFVSIYYCFKKDKNLLFLWCFAFFYLFYIAMGTGYYRYIFVLLPIFYILSAFYLISVLKNIIKKL